MSPSWKEIFSRKREFPELKRVGKGKGTSIEYLFIMLDDETSIVNISIERCTQFNFSDEAPRLIAMNRYSISPREKSRLEDQRESRLFKHRMNINSGRGLEDAICWGADKDEPPFIPNVSRAPSTESFFSIFSLARPLHSNETISQRD